MAIKRTFIVLWATLLVVSLSQLFPIPPYGEAVYSLYTSGYFVELDRQFRVVTDAFLGVKMMSRPAYAWVLLDDIEKAHGIRIRVYNARGVRVTAPGAPEGGVDVDVQNALAAPKPSVASWVSRGSYYSILPLANEGQCGICHTGTYRNNMIGAVTFKRRCDSRTFYAFERIAVFVGFSLVFALLLFATVRWDPQKSVRELFVRVDKNE
ncbi:MAG TPA: hypothetical protein PLE73_11760 [Spirochaetota bacterium]|nr:hypothetical protein [Spirochaetota bacterium]HOS39544.1 hypothetical protein [Spirochaetota bacterium]HPI23869.1 hypothetical protein [Spirochaetota bacterium]HPU87035.1 hypothetical protein [Spirochaetota bacterium]